MRGKARHSLDVVAAALSVKRFARGRNMHPPELVTAGVGSHQRSATVTSSVELLVLVSFEILFIFET